MAFQCVCGGVFKPHAHVERGHNTSMAFEHLLATGVTSLYSFFLSFVSLSAKENRDCGEAGSLAAVRHPVLHIGTTDHFQVAFPLLLPILPCFIKRRHQAKRYLRLPLPKHFTLARQRQAFCIVYRNLRQSKAERISTDLQGAELTWLAVHHAKNLPGNANVNQGFQKS